MRRAALVFVFAVAGCYQRIAPRGEPPEPDAVIGDAPGGPRDAVLDVAADAFAGPQLVQQKSAQATSVTTSLSLSLTTAPTSGDVLVMVGANTGSFLQSVTGGGVTWRRANYSALCANTEIWYGVVTSTSSAVTITCAYSGSSWMWVGEWSGLDTTNLLDVDKATGANGITSTPAPGTITTTAPRELVMLAVASNATSFQKPMPASWTALPAVGAGGYHQDEWYLVTSATGTFAPSVGPSTNCWDAAIASFRLP